MSQGNDPKQEGDAPQKAPGGPGGDRSPEDASSQALSESLRSSFLIVKIIVALLIAFFVGSLIFTVESQERAIILRLGKPGQILEPGYHWRLPFFDEVVRIPVGEVQRVESTVGWYATGPRGQPMRQLTLDPASDGYALTADGNIIHVRMTLRYEITDPGGYAFELLDPRDHIRNILDNAILTVAARYPAPDALWREVTAFKEDVLREVQEQVDEAGLGIALEPSDIETAAPMQVQDAFDEVQAASADRQQTVSEAQGYASNILAKVEGEAERVISQAETEADRYVQSVASEAEYFEDLLPEYRQQPRLVSSRLLVRTMENVLTNSREKFLFIDRKDGRSRELRLQLNRLPEEPERESEQEAGSQ